MNLELMGHRLLSALLNGGYQGILLTLLVALGLKLIPRSNAATRHLVWFATLLGVAALPVAHFVFGSSPSGPAASAAAFAPDARAPKTESTEAAFPTRSWGSSPPLTAPHPWLFSPPTLQATAPRSLAFESISTDHRRWDYQRTAHIPGNTEWSAGSGARSRLVEEAIAVEEPLATGFWDRLDAVLPAREQLAIPRQATLALLAAWLAVALFRLGRIVQQWLQLRALKRGGVEAPADWQSVFAGLGTEMGLARKTRLIIGPAGSAPLVAGFWRPAVVLPEGMFQSASEPQLHQVLRHELGHVIRLDDWANLLQQGIRAVLFFHPAVIWLCERLTLEREIACDDHVLAATRAPRSYALWLTDFAGRRRLRELAAAPAAWARQTQLKQRITMILDSKRNASTRLGLVRAGAVLTAGALFTGWVLQAGPRLELAAADPEVTVAIETDHDSNAVVSSARSIKVAPAENPTVIRAGGSTIAIVEPTVEASAEASVGGTISIESAPPAPPAPLAVYLTPTPAVQVLGAPQPPAPDKPGRTPKRVLALNSADDDHAPKPTPGKSKSKDTDEASLERRLEKLERMMDKLADSGQLKQLDAFQELAHKLQHEFSPEKVARLKDEIKRSVTASTKAGLNHAEIARMQKEVEREVQQAVRESERAVLQQKAQEQKLAAARAKGAASSARSAEERQARREEMGAQREAQRRALESARKSLEQQIQTLERQIEKLEETQDRLEDDFEKLDEQLDSGRSADDEKAPQADPQPEPKKVAR